MKNFVLIPKASEPAVSVSLKTLASLVWELRHWNAILRMSMTKAPAEIVIQRDDGVAEPHKVVLMSHLTGSFPTWDRPYG